MRLALREAREAAAEGEVPIGSAVVREGELLACGANRTRRDSVVAAHAELVALGAAQRQAGDYRLDGSTVYVTVEPCLMCLGAIMQSRCSRIVFGAMEPKFGALGGRFDLREHPALRRIEIVAGVLAEESASLLSEFFKELRRGGTEETV